MVDKVARFGALLVLLAAAPACADDPVGTSSTTAASATSTGQGGTGGEGGSGGRGGAGGSTVTRAGAIG